jgi:hypothetical protein
MVHILSSLYVAGVFTASAVTFPASFGLITLQIIFTPYPIDPFEIYMPFVFAKFYGYSSVTIPGAFFNLVLYGLKHQRVLDQQRQLISLCTS